MDNDNFFVMLQTQKGGITPMLYENEELATFATEEEAHAAAAESILGEAFGYEVFERGCGC
ncbi:hypothetical protein [Aliagarivorans taiwanensis]|uniref:hypothetical protein n=1 Tax=Aliagarivorans taiwanensis TaxID=561966 RepID=UPI00040C04FF|nr:hypothetical protein [Aliagarivorans taiwanensis]